jgi:hypothetical protein
VGATTDKAQYGFPYGVPYYLVNFLLYKLLALAGLYEIGAHEASL